MELQMGRDSISNNDMLDNIQMSLSLEMQSMSEQTKN